MKKTAILDCRAHIETVKTLEKHGFNVIPTIKIDNLYDSVATHADMQLHITSDGKIICAPETFLHYKKLLPKTCTLIKGSKTIGSEYPHDIRYNAASVGNTLLCNTRYTAMEILNSYNNSNTIPVKQGYCKCSTCIVDSNSIITSDTGIAKAARNHGIDVLEIEAGDVKLKGMNYGFIGGATGLLTDKLLAVNGNIKEHKNAYEIEAFCKKKRVDILSLRNSVLEDIGTIFAL